MSAACEFGFERRRRLVAETDYRRVFRRGRRIESRDATWIVAPSDHEESRLGLAMSRRIGGAVARNRAKRVVRESFRRLPSRGFDVVCVGKPSLCRRRQSEVDADFESVLAKLARRRSR